MIMKERFIKGLIQFKNKPVYKKNKKVIDGLAVILLMIITYIIVSIFLS